MVFTCASSIHNAVRITSVCFPDKNSTRRKLLIRIPRWLAFELIMAWRDRTIQPKHSSASEYQREVPWVAPKPTVVNLDIFFEYRRSTSALEWLSVEHGLWKCKNVDRSLRNRVAQNRHVDRSYKVFLVFQLFHAGNLILINCTEKDLFKASAWYCLREIWQREGKTFNSAFRSSRFDAFRMKYLFSSTEANRQFVVEFRSAFETTAAGTSA